MQSQRSRYDPQAPDPGMSAGRAIAERASPEGDDSGDMNDATLLRLVGEAEEASRQDMGRRLTRAVERSQRAWRNEHSSESKYNDKINYRGRSRLFVPKTRMGVRKNKAGAAAALFATTDVISIGAQYDDEPSQLASASVIQALVQYRLGGSGAKRQGVPWFQVAIAARHDADVHGICISKQFWDFEEIETGNKKTVMVQTNVDELGQNVSEPMEVPETRIVRDRPMIDLHPIENVYLDPAAPWYDPVGMGAYLIVGIPMHLSDIKAKMASKNKNNEGYAWRKVDEGTLAKAYHDDIRSGVRRARDGGNDRTQPLSMPKEWDILWVNENFIRINGQDMHFWSLGAFAMLSDPIPVEQAYPEQKGDRPYIGGMSEIDPHVTSPMPPVDSWQPLQLEINDVTNLRLDTLKRGIAPFAKVRRGRRVDYEQLKRRGQPEAMVILDDPEKDVIFEQTPGPSNAAYTEVSHANAAFDELAGSFSTTSVQTNRQLNDTVGGMKLMQGGANAVSEYDLRVWVETWVERVIQQVIHLEQYYESDEKVLSVAGKKAQAFQRYGINPTLDQLLECEVTLRVNAGVGAQDPMQRLGKLKQANDILAPYAQIMADQGIQQNMEALIEECYGAAGYKDGHRFFLWDQKQPEPPPDPKTLQVEAGKEKAKHDLIGKLKIEGAKNQTKQLEIASKERMQREAHQHQLTQGLMGQQHDQDMQANASAQEIDENGNPIEAIQNGAPALQAQGPEANPVLMVLAHLVQSIQMLNGSMQSGEQRSMQMQQAMMQGFVETIARLEAQAGAPTQFLYDNSGNLAGAVKGNKRTMLVRDQNGEPRGAVSE